MFQQEKKTMDMFVLSLPCIAERFLAGASHGVSPFGAAGWGWTARSSKGTLFQGEIPNLVSSGNFSDSENQWKSPCWIGKPSKIGYSELYWFDMVWFFLKYILWISLERLKG